MVTLCSFSCWSAGYSAFMHPLGSVFIQTLCDLLEENKGCDLEITRLMTRINYQVAYHFQARGRELKGKKEMPCFASRLTKEVYPFRASQSVEEQSGKLGHTALTKDFQRIRKRSVSWGKLPTAPEQIPLFFTRTFMCLNGRGEPLPYGMKCMHRLHYNRLCQVSWVQSNVNS